MKLPPKLFKNTAENFKLAKDICYSIFFVNWGVLCIIYLVIILSLFIERMPRPTDIQVCLLHLPGFTSIALLDLTDFTAQKVMINACNRGHRLFIWGECIQAIEPYQEALSIDRDNADAKRGLLLCLGMLELDKKEQQLDCERHEYN
jgi:hypothetical protein